MGNCHGTTNNPFVVPSPRRTLEAKPTIGHESGEGTDTKAEETSPTHSPRRSPRRLKPRDNTGKVLTPDQLREADRKLKDLINEAGEELDLSQPPGGVREDFPAIASFPPGVLKIQTLEELRIRRNHLMEIPEEIGLLQTLKVLDLGQNFLKNLPTSLFRLKQLEVLDLSSNYFRSLSEDVQHLQRLRTLMLYNNRLVHLPDSLQNCKALESLSIMDNQVIALPLWLRALPKLANFQCSGNRVKRVSEEFALSAVRRLDVRWNFIVLCPTFACHPKLVQVQASGNLIEECPLFGETLELEFIDLAHNNIMLLHSTLFKCGGLRVLHLEGNKLESIPPEIEQLTQLEELYIEQNLLEELPDELTKCANLKGLRIAENKLTILLPSLIQLTKLANMDISSNPFIITDEFRDTAKALKSICAHNKGKPVGFDIIEID